MTVSLARLLLQRSAAGSGAVLWGSDAAPHFGTDFDRLLASGVLTERAPATAWGPCRICDCAFGGREIVEIDGQLVAECPDDAAASLNLTRDDIRSFTIDAAELVRKLAKTSGLSDAPESLAEGIWHLGDLADGRGVILVLHDTAVSDPHLMTHLRALVRSPAMTLLLPPGTPPDVHRRARDAGYHIAPATEALVKDALGLDLDSLTPPAASGVRLEISNPSRTVVLDGRPILLATQPFDLLLALAEAARQHPGFLETKDIERAVYGNLTLPRARELRDLPRGLKDALAAGLADAEARAVRALIRNKRPGGYRLLLSRSEILIRY